MRPGFLAPACFVAFILALPFTCASTVETFVSPDSGFSALSEFVSGSSDSLEIATYTFTSPAIMELLMKSRGEGVRVEVMVEKSPAGGMSETEEKILCNLLERNVTVLLYDGPLRFMHAKYAIRDGGSVLVTSENLGPSGFFADSDYGNRGWGAIVHDRAVAEELGMIFDEDKKDSVPFVCGLKEYEITEWDPAGAYEPVFEKKEFPDGGIELISSPDSLKRLLFLISSANSSILVEQFYVYTHWGSVKYDDTDTAPSPLLEALIGKAREGVVVKILLDSTYYNMDEEKSVSNYNTMEYVNSIAKEENIPIEARAADLDGKGLAKVHNKGIIVDGRAVLVSSINWNENSVMNNREVGLLIRGEPAGYYSSVFYHDWGREGEEHGLGFFPAMISVGSLIFIAAIVTYFNNIKTRKSR